MLLQHNSPDMISFRPERTGEALARTQSVVGLKGSDNPHEFSLVDQIKCSPKINERQSSRSLLSFYPLREPSEGQDSRGGSPFLSKSILVDSVQRVNEQYYTYCSIGDRLEDLKSN